MLVYQRVTGWMFILQGSYKKVSQLDRVRKKEYLDSPKNGSIILQYMEDGRLFGRIELPYQNSAQWTALFPTEKNPPKVECLDLWSPLASHCFMIGSRDH